MDTTPDAVRTSQPAGGPLGQDSPHVPASGQPAGTGRAAPGPLSGVRFVELGGIGPVPHAGMLLADLGATGVRVDRPMGQVMGHVPGRDPLLRGRQTRLVDLRDPGSLDEVRLLVAESDVLIEGYRPGTTERLGLGPQDCWALNPALVYGRMTGWGQDGPWSGLAGHDITYSAIAGGLRHTARPHERPVPALNLLADFGGGSMFLVVGVLAALHEVRRTGRGVVVDAAMVDGVANLMTLVHGLRVQGLWPNPPGQNLLDGGCPFYDTYTCADGRYVAVGPLEPPFYAELLDGLGLSGEALPAQYDVTGWPVLRGRFTQVFASQPRDHWARVFEGTDACVVPVLEMTESPHHRHLSARGTFVVDERSGQPVPGPAPRFGPRSSGPASDAPTSPG